MRIALIVGFLLLVLLLGVGLTLNPRQVPSPLVGKPAPNFELPQLGDASVKFTPAEMRGKVWLLNVWASWCVACRDEHPVLIDFARAGHAPLVGLNYKDPSEDAVRWLKRYGDPYLLSAVDMDGRIGIDYGVYGVPETYVIDRDGVIRYKQIGPVNEAIMQKKIVPLIKALEQ